MNDLSKTKLFYLLMNSLLSVTNKEMQSAYETFVEQVQTLNQTETDCQRAFRPLTLARIEFQSLQAQILYEQGGKCVEKSVFSKSNLVSRIGN